MTINWQEKLSFVDYKTRGSELYPYNSINQEAEQVNISEVHCELSGIFIGISNMTDMISLTPYISFFQMHVPFTETWSTVK